MMASSAWECAPRLHHGRILFLKALPEPFRTFQVFVHTSHHAAFFSCQEGFGGKVVDAVVEASLY